MGFLKSLDRSLRGKSGSGGFRKLAKIASAPVRAAAAADPVYQKIRYGAVGSNTTRLNNASDILYDADPIAKNIGITQNAAREITKTAAAAAGIYFAAAGVGSYLGAGSTTPGAASGGYPYGAYPAGASGGTASTIGSTLVSVGKQVGTAIVGLVATKAAAGLLAPKTPDGQPGDLVASSDYNPLTSLFDALSGKSSGGGSSGGGGGGGGDDEQESIFSAKNILIGLAVLIAAFFFLRR